MSNVPASATATPVAPVAPVVRRRIKTEGLIKYDLGNGAFLYTNATGAAMSFEWDSGDGIVRRATIQT